MSSVTVPTSLRVTFAVVLALGAVHCSGSTVAGNADGGPSDSGRPPGTLTTPKEHRPQAIACSTARAPSRDVGAGVDSGIAAGECAKDVDCTKGTNGRCQPAARTAINFCSYDACSNDSACGANGVCACATEGADGQRSAHACLTGNCTIDAACGAGSYCSPSLGTNCGRYGGVVGYFCHTPQDTCTNDDECGGGFCAWTEEIGKWACSNAACAG